MGARISRQVHRSGQRAHVGRPEGRLRGAPDAQARRPRRYLRVPSAVQLPAYRRSVLGPAVERGAGPGPFGEFSPGRRRQHGHDAAGSLVRPHRYGAPRRGVDQEHRGQHRHHGDHPVLGDRATVPSPEDRLRRERHGLGPLPAGAGGPPVRGAKAGPRRAGHQAQRDLPPPVLRQLLVRGRRRKDAALHRHRQHHVGVGLPSPHRDLARLAEIHRGVDEGLAGGRAPEGAGRQRGEGV